MTRGIKFHIEELEKAPQLNQGLKSKVRLLETRALELKEQYAFDADFDGDGERDKFILNIKDSKTARLISLPNNYKHTIFLPGGIKAIEKIIPGDADGDGDADLLILRKTEKPLLLVNETYPAKTKTENRKPYEEHLKEISRLMKGGKIKIADAVKKSIYYNLGMTHTWVLPEAIDTPLTWLDGKPPYTDCYFETMRVLAELANVSGTRKEFDELYLNTQYYNYDPDLSERMNNPVIVPEHADFFTVEALPHLIALGHVTDVTESLHKEVKGTSAPAFNATINKQSWSEALEKPLYGKTYSEWKVTLNYYPFADLLSTSKNTITINKKLSNELPPFCIIVVMNANRKNENLGTEIPDSHIAFLIKEPGKWQILHSTPTTSLGLAAATTETIEDFFKTRFVKIEDGQIINKDKTAVGVKILKTNRLSHPHPLP